MVMQYRTSPAIPSEVQREWHVIDATGRTLGRLSTEIATLLRGKHKPSFSPHVDCGDYVVVVNAGKVRLSSDKADTKNYYTHSQYPGGLKTVSFQKMLETHPTRIIEHSVRGMLPDNRLARVVFKKLKVYAGPTHPHERHIAGLKRAKAAQVKED